VTFFFLVGLSCRRRERLQCVVPPRSDATCASAWQLLTDSASDTTAILSVLLGLLHLLQRAQKGLASSAQAGALELESAELRFETGADGDPTAVATKREVRAAPVEGSSVPGFACAGQLCLRTAASCQP